LYVQPIYLQAKMEGSGSQQRMPELKRVVAAMGDKLAYGTSFEDAMQKLLGSAAYAPVPQAEQTAGAVAAPVPADIKQKALQLLEQYKRSISEGKFAEAGKALDELKALLAAK